MPELHPARFDVVSCHGTHASCDAVMRTEGACRVAADEVMVVDRPGTAAGIVGRVADVVDAHAVVVDATDGWSAWSIEGEDAAIAFSYLSELELPPAGFVQGDVVRLPAKVLTDGRRLHILVPAMFGEELRRRIVASAGHLGLTGTSA
jgi:hypothetical protein